MRLSTYKYPKKPVPLQQRRHYCAAISMDQFPRASSTHKFLRTLQQWQHSHGKSSDANLKGFIDKTLPNFQSKIETAKSLPQIDPNGIFANGELSFSDVDYFGFDYDYTLASYTDRVQYFIYEEALDFLVKQLGYPEELLYKKYDPYFAIRGLHFDYRHGNLLKIDAFDRITVDYAYHGKIPLTLQQLNEQYPGLSMLNKYSDTLISLSDLYCLPEACLLADVIQFFRDRGTNFNPETVYFDVMKAKDSVHGEGRGILHKNIVQHLPEFLLKHPKLGEFLTTLKQHNKKLFLLSNSHYWFIDQGMSFLLANQLGHHKHWTELFDVIITASRKPSWYQKKNSGAFRKLNTKTDKISWEKVTRFDPGEIYVGGSMEEFQKITGWKGDKILYFGDHIFNDLKEPKLIEGWRTGVIIRELEKEIEIQNTNVYRTLLAEVLLLESFFKHIQLSQNPAVESLERIVRAHHIEVRSDLKSMFNPHFGSVFRNHRYATKFEFNLQRYAAVYTSQIENFLNFPMDYLFYPDRIFLPHESNISNIL